MPSANLIQSAKRWLGTAITTGISALKARSTRYDRPLPSRSCLPEPVDDHEVGALVDRAGDLRAGVQQLADIQPASVAQQDPRSWNSCSSSPVWTSIAESLASRQ